MKRRKRVHGITDPSFSPLAAAEEATAQTAERDGRQAMPRAEPTLSLAALHVDKSLFAAILLLLIRLFCRPMQKETPAMHPPNGPLDRLHSPEQRPFSAFCHQNPFPPMPPTGNKSGWYSDCSPPVGNLRIWGMAERE